MFVKSIPDLHGGAVSTFAQHVVERARRDRKPRRSLRPPRVSTGAGCGGLSAVESRGAMRWPEPHGGLGSKAARRTTLLEASVVLHSRASSPAGQPALPAFADPMGAVANRIGA